MINSFQEWGVSRIFPTPSRHTAEGTVLMLKQQRLMNFGVEGGIQMIRQGGQFTPDDADFGGRFDAQLNAPLACPDHTDDNIVSDPDDVVSFSRQYQHGHASFPGRSLS